MKLTLRQKIRQGERVIGTFLKTPNPHVAELLGLSGLDFVVADREHAPVDLQALDMLVMAGRGVGLPILFRALSHDPSAISPAFDLGVEGVMAPHVRDGCDIDMIADGIKYARGKRGFSPSGRAGAYGSLDPATYRKTADDTNILMAQIEDVSALSKLDEIATSPDVDVLFVGPADLGLSMGVSPNDPKLQAAIKQVADAADRAGKSSGIFVSNAADVAAWAARGMTVFVCGSDQSLLLGAARRLYQIAKNPSEEIA
jgi:2-keto-3-deoxy-L-rhamnonate aldolase RhmA